MAKTRPSSIWLYPIVAALLGFSANLAQVSLFRFFMGLFYGTEMHLGIFLSIWLFGISSGGYVGGRKAPGLQTLSLMILCSIFLSAAAIYFGHSFLPDPKGGFLSFQPVIIFMAAAVIPVSFLIGMLLPALLKKSDRSLGIFYGYEAFGSFFAGVFFSFWLGGTARPVLCLISLPIPILTAGILLSPGLKKAAAMVLLVVPLIFTQGEKLAENIENSYWKVANPSQTLVATRETPYQKLQLCSYHEQKSLFSNGMFSGSWPLTDSSEQLVHCFMTALERHDQVLIVGAPPPDVIAEFLKYAPMRLTVIELDQGVIDFYDYPDEQKQKIDFTIEDPRKFFNSSNLQFDGIMIFPVSPVTLAGNRLFTSEAFIAMRERLNQRGVLSLQVSGSENYLGSIKEQIILSTWQTLKAIFPFTSALPGTNITFFASRAEDVVPVDVKGFMNRFRERRIQTATFLPMSFFNILQPFRVKELEEWLARPLKARPNTDLHPESFSQQLELWNVYSGASLNRLMEFLQKFSLRHFLIFIIIVLIVFLFLSKMMNAGKTASLTVAGGVAISGATGLLCEIILILLYQNRYGAAYQMTAFFFGIYMLGLAGGAWLFGHRQSRRPAFSRLKRVKALQIVFTLAGVILLQSASWHNAYTIAAAIFIIAFLDGIEFPVADRILRDLGNSSSYSAGLLLFADNAGALLAGLSSGLWLLPTLGMQGCFVLLATMLAANQIALFLLKKNLNEFTTQNT